MEQGPSPQRQTGMGGPLPHASGTSSSGLSPSVSDPCTCRPTMHNQPAPCLKQLSKVGPLGQGIHHCSPDPLAPLVSPAFPNCSLGTQLLLWQPVAAPDCPGQKWEGGLSICESFSLPWALWVRRGGIGWVGPAEYGRISFHLGFLKQTTPPPPPPQPEAGWHCTINLQDAAAVTGLFITPILHF